MKIVNTDIYSTCCDCGRTAVYRIETHGYLFCVCHACLGNYTEREEEDDD